MKMNLSVVMDIVDKVKAPLAGMSSESDHYAKKIEKIKKAQQDDTAALAMIASYQNTQEAINKNALALNAAQQELTQLQAKEKAAKQSALDISNQYQKQIEALSKLKQQMAQAKNPSQALKDEIANQEAAVGKLNLSMLDAQKKSSALSLRVDKLKDKTSQAAEDNEHLTKTLKQLAKEMRKQGTSLTDLDGDTKGLTKSQKAHQVAIDKTAIKYAKLRKVLDPLSKINKSIKLPTLDNIKGASIGGSAAIGTMAGLGLVITNTAEDVRKLAQAADDVKMPTDILQALRLQAVDAGAEAEDMDAALREMTLRWGEMKSLRSGAMNDYFKDTGNRKAYEDLKNAKSAQEAYQVLIREIAAEQDDAKRNFMMDEFFGGDSEKMIKVLGAGLEGYQGALQKLQDTGGPITQDSIDSAMSYSSALKTLRAIFDSLKVSALTPIMKELSIVMKELASNMKNVEWRNEMIEQLKTGVMTAFAAIRSLGQGIVFLSQNFEEIIAVAALLKIGMIALNAAMMANPIGLIVSGIAALTVGFIYLIDHLGGFKKVFNDLSIWFKKRILDLVSYVPDFLLPDSWSQQLDAMKKELDALESKSVEVRVSQKGEIPPLQKELSQLYDKQAEVGFTQYEEKVQTVTLSQHGEVTSLKNDLNQIKDKSVELGITKNETVNQSVSTRENVDQQSRLNRSSEVLGNTYTPISNHIVKSQAEVSLTVKSDKPVQVDKVKSDKNTGLNVNVGDMAFSY
ncbi:hypothetical protein [Vibrio sp. OPT18]|uniref:hypothetical protein n=1 Tax=Vibrio sp. OPT18 TaxID=2778641 RepID=UPI001882F28D|nr:hypothetical protein [Vibrio sp. OPT18]MBE8574465.1 hypothetical protein [Vibrio sp. OPT18]